MNQWERIILSTLWICGWFGYFQDHLFYIYVLIHVYDLTLCFDRPSNEPTREKSHSVHFESVVDLAGPVSDSMTMHKEMVGILSFKIFMW